MGVGLCVFKRKTAYEMRISDWSSDVCSSDLEISVDILVDRLVGDVADQEGCGAGDGGEQGLAGAVLRRHQQDDDPEGMRLHTGEAVAGEDGVVEQQRAGKEQRDLEQRGDPPDRKSVVSGKSVSVRLGIGGRRLLKKKQKNLSSDVIGSHI